MSRSPSIDSLSSVCSSDSGDIDLTLITVAGTATAPTPVAVPFTAPSPPSSTARPAKSGRATATPVAMLAVPRTAATLALPPSTTVPPTLLPPSSRITGGRVPAFPARDSPQRSAGDRLSAKSGGKRLVKVPLAPGHSALDWARLKSSGQDLRGVRQLGRYTLDELRQHRTEQDCWCALHGKVYNLTSYLPFHPGGKRDILAVAGKDATRLFMETHGWVNAEMMLDKCLVGFLVRD